MSYFFITTLQAFLCVALLCGVNWSHRQATLRPLVWNFALALAGGMWTGLHLTGSQPLQLGLVGAEILLLLLFLLTCSRSAPRLGYFWQAVLIIGAARRWVQDPNLGAITSTHVLNTDLLLNITALTLAFALLILAAVLAAMLLRRLSWTRWPLALLLVVLLLLPISGDLLLLLMKLQVMPLTKVLLSFVAHVTNNASLFNWAGALLLLLLAAGWWPTLRARRREVAVTSGPVARRLACARYLGARRLLLTTLCCALIIAAGQGYWDQVASQPPRLSEAQPVTLAADGQVHIPLDQVRDGKLHRFVWIADDGKAVRFFVINRYPDRMRPGVVFDACLLCGDQGYVMEGNQVICVACGVHIFIPSIGKAGGCNPVPIDGWQTSEHELTIPQAALAAGANYFSTVVTLKVTDPVNGASLTNVQAEYKYSYAGKTWFFASEANYNRFRATPEQFVPGGKEE
ncbi:Fe-S-containing protein [Pantoea sp. B65]|uniref:Fe-S-containing protein n=1 Tax=Pantoea sp. B65 TaxID=2813359 RepID=UPI0039B5BBB5